MDMARGDPLTLSSIRSTVHLGAHADGENHYVLDGRSVDAMPLDRYLGPCRVVSASVSCEPGGARVGIDDLDVAPADVGTSRVLIATGTQPDKSVFNDDFAGLDPGLIDALAAAGVRTIGVDTPSVDVATSKDLPGHGACARHGIAIIEGLDLSAVDAGVYELIALPLALVGFDASPVRAVLRSLV